MLQEGHQSPLPLCSLLIIVSVSVVVILSSIVSIISITVMQCDAYQHHSH